MKQKIIELIKSTILFKYFRKRFYEVNIKQYKKIPLDECETAEYIRQLLNSDKPCMISRLGSTELRIVEQYNKKTPYTDKAIESAKRNAGIFPADKETLNEFSELYLADITQIDLLGIWFNPYEDVMVNKYSPNANITKLRNLEPYFSNTPWSQYLKGKKVLVIHPFIDSINEQFKIRDQLFENKNVLPDFELKLFQAVQSIGGNENFSSWFEALEQMKNEISNIDFDIAIIGAGAYGLPLASFIKRMGKKAIHLGGATQMLFGVYGKRWENHPDFKNIINEHWIKPSENETPKSATKVENACYW